MLKAYKYRIYPNSEQRIQIAKTFGCCRFVYNQTLAYRKEIYEKEKKSVSKTDCNNYCNRELKKDYEWLKEIDKFALTNAIYNMDTAYQKFFKEHAGYPKFKSKHDNHKSYTTNFTNGNIAVDFETGKIKLPKLKAVKARLHREYSGQIKSATVSQVSSGKYYVSILVETEHKELAHTNHNIGIDLGIKEDKITYIPNYVSKDDFYPLSQEVIDKRKEKYGIEKNKFIVLGCGQVQTRKGVKDFIKCAELLPDVQFVWAGGFSFGPITDGYKELKAIMDNPPKNVKFIGIIPRTEMNEIFNMADVLFMPSFSELFPMSILEAVNSSKPVLLRDLELYVDILFGKYLKGNSAEEWVELINKLRQDSEFYKSAQEDSKYISEFYSKENVNKIWREYYPRVYNKYIKNGKKIKN